MKKNRMFLTNGKMLELSVKVSTDEWSFEEWRIL